MGAGGGALALDAHGDQYGGQAEGEAEFEAVLGQEGHEDEDRVWVRRRRGR